MVNTPKNVPSGYITAEQAARLLLRSTERIRQIVNEGYIPKAEKGLYPLVPLVQGYIRFRDDEDRRSSKTRADSELKKTRQKQIEMKMAADAGELIPFEEAQAFAQHVIGKLMSSLSGLPAQLMRNLDDRRALEAAIDEIRSKVVRMLEADERAYRDLQGADTADEEADAG